MKNLEKKEHMIMRDGKFATMMQQQEEDEAQKSMEKEKWAMKSTPTGKDLLFVQRVFWWARDGNRRLSFLRRADLPFFQNGFVATYF